MKLNGQTLQALRKMLFFSVKDAAEMIGNVKERTWKYWESGEGKIPNDVEETIHELVVMRDEFIAYIETAVSEVVKNNGTPNSMRLTYYTNMDDWLNQQWAGPLYWWVHCSAMAYAAAKYGAVLIKFDDKKYRTWLGNRDDNSAMRAAWAASLDE